MANLWSRLERQLDIRTPGLAANLWPGISEIALAAFEDEIGQRLPEDGEWELLPIRP